MASDKPDLKQNENIASQITADEQIAEHRAMHQQKLKKVMFFIAVLVLLGIVAALALHFVKDEPSSQMPVNRSVSVDYTDEEITRYREEIRQTITDYEINIQPNIDKILLSDWETQKATELGLLKEQALTAFAQGRFSQAIALFEQLRADSITLINSWQAQTEQYISLASEAFRDDQIPLAQLNINKALALMPTNLDAIALQTRIHAHAEVATLLSDLKVAQIENNLPKQIDLLSGIIELDPQRESLNTDLAEAQVVYDQQQLAQLLANAEQSLSQNKLVQAQSYVVKAKAIKPDSKGAQVLNDKIEQARLNDVLSKAKNRLTELASADKWEEVSDLSSTKLKQYPNDETLQNFQDTAQSVLVAKRSLSVFLTRPERLSDNNIRDAASNAISQALVPSIKSPSLQSQVTRLADIIDQYSEPVKVTVNSDGNTYITVIGVGHVGEHTQKEIELMPGDYVLQGRREGYRNKRLPFTVKANSPLSLTLICDEKL